MRTTQAIWLALALSTLACHQSPAVPHEVRRQDGPFLAESKVELNSAQRAAPVAAAVDEALTGSASAAGQQSPNPFATGWDDDPTVMIIRTGTASIGIDSLEPALAHVRALATRVGGYVANTEIQAGAAQYRQATLEVKVPAARFDDLVAGLDPARQARIGERDRAGRRRGVRRRERARHELPPPRESLDRPPRHADRPAPGRPDRRARAGARAGRDRAVRGTAPLSQEPVGDELALDHRARAAAGGGAPDNVLVRAFERAWRNFVELAAGFIASLGVLVPLVVAGGTAVWGIRRFRRPATP